MENEMVRLQNDFKQDITNVDRKVEEFKQDLQHEVTRMGNLESHLLKLIDDLGKKLAEDRSEVNKKVEVLKVSSWMPRKKWNPMK